MQFSYTPHTHFEANDKYPPYVYPEHDEMVRIMKTYGVVEFVTDENGVELCRVRSFWEPGMPRLFKYISVNCGGAGGAERNGMEETCCEAAYYELYYCMWDTMRNEDEQ
jgi:hypothetical protein